MYDAQIAAGDPKCPGKELSPVARDLGFCLTGRCDCNFAGLNAENWLYLLDWGYNWTG
jgi:hypothetical protein